MPNLTAVERAFDKIEVERTRVRKVVTKRSFYLLGQPVEALSRARTEVGER